VRGRSIPGGREGRSPGTQESLRLASSLSPPPRSRAMARKNGYTIAFNQEIVALGIANFFGAAFSA